MGRIRTLFIGGNGEEGVIEDKKSPTKNEDGEMMQPLMIIPSPDTIRECSLEQQLERAQRTGEMGVWVELPINDIVEVSGLPEPKVVAFCDIRGRKPTKLSHKYNQLLEYIQELERENHSLTATNIYLVKTIRDLGKGQVEVAHIWSKINKIQKGQVVGEEQEEEQTEEQNEQG